MENKNMQLTITEEDKSLYDLLKNCNNEEMMKDLLNRVVDLYKFSNGDSGELPGYPTPEKLKENKLKAMDKEALMKLREEYLNLLLLNAQDYHPDEIDCGIMRGPDDDYWFIDDGGRLGYISLYANYIKMIDEIIGGK